jgi:uncharacterized membrane protein YfhO
VTYANADALPRVYFASETRPLSHAALQDGMMENRAPLTTAFVEGLETTQPVARGKVFDTAWGQNRVTIDVETSDPGYLVVAMTHYPGWTATVDGAVTPLRRTNGAITGLSVPAGARRIVLSYSSAPFRRGLVCACGGLILLGVITTLSGPRRTMRGPMAE